MLRLRSVLVGSLVFVVLACKDAGDEGGAGDDELGDSGSEDSDSGPGESETSTSETASESSETEIDPSPCDALVEGLNQDFDIDGVARTFYLDLPADIESGGPWPVVFSWHGLGDTATNFRNLFSGAVDGPQLQFILVTPEDTDHPITIPLAGTVALDWDTFQVAEGGVGNKEVALFDTLLECLDQRWGVDPAHVHSAGFSLGAVTTDMLASVRGEQLAAVAAWSGGYWNNPENLGLSLNIVASWPEYAVENPYPQLLIHGGPSDEFVVFENVYTMSFYGFALADTDFLAMHGHPLVVCDHGAGHSAPASVSPATVLSFFAEHPLGVGSSPWLATPPSTGLDDCTLLLSP